MEIKEKEILLISELLSRASDQTSDGPPSILNQKIFKDWSDKEKDAFCKELQEYNGDFEDPFPLKVKDIPDWLAMEFFADKYKAKVK